MEAVRHGVTQFLASQAIQHGLFYTVLAGLCALAVYPFYWMCALRLRILMDIYHYGLWTEKILVDTPILWFGWPSLLFYFIGWPIVALSLAQGVTFFTWATIWRTLLFPDLHYMQLLVDNNYHLIPQVRPVAVLETVAWAVLLLRSVWVGRAARQAAVVHQQSQTLWHMVHTLNSYQLKDMAARLRELLGDSSIDTGRRRSTVMKLTAIGQRLMQNPGSAAIEFLLSPSVCVVCMEAPPTMTLHPCCHTILCEQCYTVLYERDGQGMTCPECRTLVLDTTYKLMAPRTYLSPEQYTRVGKQATERELERLYEYGHKNRDTLSQTLQHCPPDAFSSRSRFDHYNTTTREERLSEWGWWVYGVGIGVVGVGVWILCAMEE